MVVPELETCTQTSKNLSHQCGTRIDVYYLYGYFRIFIKGKPYRTNHSQFRQHTSNRTNRSKIERERDAIKRAENTLLQLDSALEKYVELGAVTKGLNAKKRTGGRTK